MSTTFKTEGKRTAQFVSYSRHLPHFHIPLVPGVSSPLPLSLRPPLVPFPRHSPPRNSPDPSNRTSLGPNYRNCYWRNKGLVTSDGCVECGAERIRVSSEHSSNNTNKFLPPFLRPGSCRTARPLVVGSWVENWGVTPWKEVGSVCVGYDQVAKGYY